MSNSALSTRAAQNETLWRERVARHAASGKTIAVFCREEGIGRSTLSNWGSRLGLTETAVPKPVTAPTFVDLGPVKATQPQPPSASPSDFRAPASIELRLDLGHGIVLHIARH